jgi:8-oxo-dGTP pyrophosphatase MutT (NUDIX family)
VSVTDVIIKGRRRVAANTKWAVYFDHLADSRGNEVGDYLVIEGPLARADGVTGVCVLPILDGRFVLVRCYRHALRSNAWEAPRGFIDANESPADAALRELGEETGLACAPTDLVPLGFYAPEPSTIGGRAAVFAARACRGELRAAGDEIGLDAIQAFDARSMAAMAADGAIEEAGTLIAYYPAAQAQIAQPRASS